MKLSAQQILFHIRRAHISASVSGGENDRLYGRPALFEYEGTPRENVVLISENRMIAYISSHAELFGNSLLVCTPGIDVSELDERFSVIRLDGNASANAVFNLLQDIHEKFDSWIDSLKNSCYKDGSFQDLIDCCEQVAFDPICIMDSQFQYIAYSRLSKETGIESYIDTTNKMRPQAVLELLSNRVFIEDYKNQSAFVCSYPTGNGVTCNAFSEGEYIGRVIALVDINDPLTTAYYLQLLEKLTKYIEFLYSKHSSFNTKEIYTNLLRNYILDSLSGKEISDSQWMQIKAENKWSDNDSFQLIQLRPNPRYDKTLYTGYLNLEIERLWHGCTVFEHEGKICMLVNLDAFESREGRTFYQALAYFLRDFLLSAGVSRAFPDFMYLRSAYKQTDIALTFGMQASPELCYHRFDDYALSYMLHNAKGDLESEMICSEKLIKLKRHDARKKTDYYNTLHAYFECNFNAVAASKRLYIQRSTFLYRMGKIKELVDIDYESKDEVLHIVLSYRLMEDDDL